MYLPERNTSLRELFLSDKSEKRHPPYHEAVSLSGTNIKNERNFENGCTKVKRYYLQHQTEIGEYDSQEYILDFCVLSVFVNESL